MIEIHVHGSLEPAIVDADFAWLSKYKWRVNPSGYVFRHGDRKIYMHREIVGNVTDGHVVDHVNRNKLDNTRSNLRVITPAQNAQNVGANCSSTSHYRGVYFDLSRKKWVAAVRHNGKNHNLGRFDCELEAAKAAEEGRKRLLPFSVEENQDGLTRF